MGAEPEKVYVLAKFAEQGFVPVSFRRGVRHYPIDGIHMRYEKGHGRERFVYFYVTSGGNTYRLRFSTEAFTWQLEFDEFLERG